MRYMGNHVTLHPGGTVLNLSEVLVRPVRSLEEQRFQELMQAHHYLGALPKISETLWYAASPFCAYRKQRCQKTSPPT